MKASIIIPAYNNLRLTAACVEAVRSCADSREAEIIISDDGSSDGTARWASAAGLRTAVGASNLGFARACNLGAAAAAGDCLVFLNNDTIPARGWLAALLKCAAGTGAGVAGGKLLFPDGTIQHAGITFREDGLPSNFLRGQPYGDEPFVNERRAFQAVTGACMLVRKDLFQKLGGFDTAFRNGYEDTDLCLRAGALGEKVIYEPACVAVHHEAMSIGRSNRADGKLAFFLSRWGGRARGDDSALRREFFGELTGTPQNYCTVVAGGGSYRNLDRCLAMLVNSAVESLDAHSIYVADYGVPGMKEAVADLSRVMGLELGLLHCAQKDAPRTVMGRAAVSRPCEFIAVVSPDTVVSPGWAHRLAMHLRSGRAAMVGPLYGGLKGSQGFNPAELRPAGACVPLAELSSALFSARRGRSSFVDSLLPHCLMTRASGGNVPASAFPAAVAEDTLVYMEERV